MDKTFASDLLTWYQENRRYLPWREDPKPYHVFLSEIMLQQTRVDTVVPYFQRFLERYPTLQDLAEAKEEDVLLLWQGLGYYSRAKNLLKATKMVVDQFGGQFPSEEKELRTLPGVGEYVSRAIRAIAFDLPAVAVDGNLLRVYARLEALPIDVGEASSKKDCMQHYQERMEHPRDFNQALMDLGELVCLPNGTPKCEVCPFKNRCKSRAQGNPLSYPLPKKKADLRRIRLAVLLLKDGDLIAIRRRDDNGLLASLYEFPNVEGTFTEKKLLEAMPSLTSAKKVGLQKHRFSHIEWTMDVFLCSGTMEGVTMVPLQDIGVTYSLPTAFSKLLTLLK